MTRVIKTLLLTLLSYLLQATAMPLMSFHSISPNINIAILSIIIVGYGRQHGVVASFIIGILMETMIQNLVYFHLLIYPVIAILSMLAFADKTERRMEMERATRRYYGNMNPLLRTLLCTIYMSVLYELVNLGYGMLTGIELSTGTYMRILLFVAYTALLSIVLMIPTRAFLGLKSSMPKLGGNKQRAPKELDPTLGRQPRFDRKAAGLDEIDKPSKKQLSSAADKNPTELPDIDQMFKVESYQRVIALTDAEKENLNSMEMHVDNAPVVEAADLAPMLEKEEHIIDEESGMETIIIPIEPRPEPEIDLERFKRPKQSDSTKQK